GGWIVSPSDPNAKANFAVAGGIKNGFWGHLLFVDHGKSMRVKGTGVTGYDVYPAFGANGRLVGGTADVDGTAESYEADVADNNEPGAGADKFQLKLTDVFITNILKCRPPGNRDPQPLEVEACSPYLEQQQRLIKPEVVLLLGRHALARLLPGYESISRLHGKVIVKDGVTYIPVYHPAAALYNSFLMGPLGQDFNAVKAYLDRVDERRRVLVAAAAPVAKPEE